MAFLRDFSKKNMFFFEESKEERFTMPLEMPFQTLKIHVSYFNKTH